jgi:hypothetical protein
VSTISPWSRFIRSSRALPHPRQQLQLMEDLSRQVAELSAERSRRPDKRSCSRDDAASELGYRPQKRGRQTSATAYIYTATTRSLFIMDSCNKKQFLIDTDADLSVSSRKFIPQREDAQLRTLQPPHPTYGGPPSSASLCDYVKTSRGDSL